MRAVDVLLLAFDHAWSHRWESLREALAGVGAEEAAWQAPAYADVEREPGWPAPGSIQGQVAHVAHCKRHYTEFLTQRDRAGRPPAPPRTPDLDWQAELAELGAAHAAQRAAIAALSDADLATQVGNAMGVAEFVTMCTRHDVWHAAQLALARRLYRARAR
jgi:hypothetical protein